MTIVVADDRIFRSELWPLAAGEQMRLPGMTTAHLDRLAPVV
jgi:hypothetical protein